MSATPTAQPEQGPNTPASPDTPSTDTEAPATRLDALLAQARRSGMRIDGIALLRAVLSESLLKDLERLVFNTSSLELLRQTATRIEFIVDGPFPPRLLEESPLKTEDVFDQVIDYSVCKGCRLCIQVCPKHVYVDDGFGRPDRDNRHPLNCTGPHQCGQCIDICPEGVLDVVHADPAFQSTVFVLLPNPCQGLGTHSEEDRRRELFVANPLEPVAPLDIPDKLDPRDLRGSHEVLNRASFLPILETAGYARHFVDAADPEETVKIWAKENGRDPRLAVGAVRLLYRHLPRLEGLSQGKYRLDEVIHRIIDEVIHTNIDMRASGSRQLLARVLVDAFAGEDYLGAKRRPIGGLLPPGTSVAWKTPYGEELPAYVHLEKCLGPECGLCVTHCPEGGGGKNSAIRMVFNVPQGTISALVRGFDVFLLRLDGSHAETADLEDLRGRQAFDFEVYPEYCKACGICIICCPHDVIEPATRQFDLKQVSE